MAEILHGTADDKVDDNEVSLRLYRTWWDIDVMDIFWHWFNIENVGKTKDVLTEDTEEAFEDELTANVVKTEN